MPALPSEKVILKVFANEAAKNYDHHHYDEDVYWDAIDNTAGRLGLPWTRVEEVVDKYEASR